MISTDVKLATPVAYSDGHSRVHFENSNLDALLEHSGSKTIFSSKLLDFLPHCLAVPVQIEILNFLFTPHVLTLESEPVPFWSITQIESLNAFVIDMSLQPPSSIFQKFGSRCFVRGCFDQSYLNGGIFVVSAQEPTFKSLWTESDDTFVAAEGTALVSMEDM